MRSKGTGLLIFGLLVTLSSMAGDGPYAVSRIPAALMKKANAIKRIEQIRFEIKSPGEAVLIKKYAITVLNENGDEHAAFSEYYDKLHEIRNVEGSLYDAAGKELKRLKNKQIMDLSGSEDGSSLIDDNRWKLHRFYHKVYPYTVEYEVEIKYNGTLFFPLWLPREDESYSVEQSSITIAYSPSYKIRYRAFNYTSQPVATAEKNVNTLTWEVRELPAIESEYAMPGWFDLNTAVLFGPSDFEIEKYTGNMSDWKEFGKFVQALKQGRDVLPDNIKQTVHQLTDKLTDPKEKIEKLYAYMQKNTRYISIQLGIGGWQPFDAKYVATKSYGDCKALTNYMYSILKEAGIKSDYTLVKAGRRASKVIADFPSQQFNHVILSVPLAKDTVWLECTSQTMPAGYLGDFTCDRYALVINENGGTLVRTPKYGLKENTQLRNIKATLTGEATLEINAETAYGGLQQDRYHGLINNLSKDKVKEALQEELDFATYDIRNFDYKETKQSLPVIIESLDISVSNYATITGKRLFIMPNVMTRHHRKLSVDSTRKYDLELGFEYRDTDTVQISLPEGYSAESLPKDAAIESKFGKYNAAVKLEGNKLLYYRNIEHKGGRFPATDYPELVKFYETIYKADRSKVVLVKKEETKGF
jgi:Domain of Unknown Function with PDB structure (DUF3857)/Transglutaminase-like superfamily